MKKYSIVIIAFFFLISKTPLFGQSIKFNRTTLQPVQVNMSIKKTDGKEVVEVSKDLSIEKVDQPTFVKIASSHFTDGIIEVKVLSRLLKNAPDSARGFIGIAFRINGDNSKFECIYIRPTNGRADQQIRRNHSVQYFSFPDYPFFKLRKENPEQYETYADMVLNEWINLRIEVKGKQAKLFINDGKQPSFLVNDLKLGPDAEGAIGLFVDVGTDGFFTGLKILPTK